MTIFDRIANLRDRIVKTRDKLEFLEMKADTPRSSVFSDMPKGAYNASNPLEQYMIEKEEAEERLKTLKAKFDRLWEKASHQMDTLGIDEQVKFMMYLRFCRGLKWEKCATALNDKYPTSRWNTNKCFRKYRDVLYRFRKERQEKERANCT